jgi:hypothetical protein
VPARPDAIDERTVHDWIVTATHPKTGRLYREMVYQPMLELLGYLRANGFRTFIFSGGGAEFMRVFAETVYGIPPEQVIGSTGRLQFELRDGGPVLVKLPEVDFIDDKAGKPVGIHRHIGRRPVFAFGNSDGDLQQRISGITRGACPQNCVLAARSNGRLCHPSLDPTPPAAALGDLKAQVTSRPPACPVCHTRSGLRFCAR